MILYQNGGKTDFTNKIPNLHLVADTSFTRDKTGVGDIEVFDGYDTITYPNGYQIVNPYPKQPTILYNPNTNTEQNIRLDALHMMPKYDENYYNLREQLAFALSRSKYYSDFLREQEYKRRNGIQTDGERQEWENWVDGKIRNLMYRGTPKDFERDRYSYEEPGEMLLSDPNIRKAYETLERYLNEQ